MQFQAVIVHMWLCYSGDDHEDRETEAIMLVYVGGQA